MPKYIIIISETYLHAVTRNKSMHNCVPKTTRSKTKDKEQNKCYRRTDGAKNTKNERGRNEVASKPNSTTAENKG